jgi:hypothetical protein
MSGPLHDDELDALLRRELRAPQPSAQWRQRVLAATVFAAAPLDAAARQLALAKAQQRSSQRIAAERKALLQQMLRYVLIAVTALALLPSLVEHLGPVFGAVPRLGVDGLSFTIGMVALCCGLAAGFPRQRRELLGV